MQTEQPILHSISEISSAQMLGFPQKLVFISSGSRGSDFCLPSTHLLLLLRASVVTGVYSHKWVDGRQKSEPLLSHKIDK